jgi:hypothetical protein
MRAPPKTMKDFLWQLQGFVLAEYLKVFVEKLGYNLQTYETLDSCKLVPYQCPGFLEDFFIPVGSVKIMVYPPWGFYWHLHC